MAVRLEYIHRLEAWRCEGEAVAVMVSVIKPSQWSALGLEGMGALLRRLVKDQDSDEKWSHLSEAVLY